MGRLLLASALLMAMASAAAAQSSGAQSNGSGPGATIAPTALGTGATATLPVTGNGPSACTAATLCASFPLTPLGAANPSLEPNLSPAIGTQANRTGGAIASPSAGVASSQTGALNPTGVLNQGALNQAGSAIASPGIEGIIGATLNQTGGLNQAGGLNRTAGAAGSATTGTAAGQTGGTPASSAPSMSSNNFAAQCASSPNCSAAQGP